MRGPLGVRWYMYMRFHTDAASERESLNVSTKQKGPNKRGASLVRHR